ncbi:15216_t:CDS:2 [Funneliformis caledonium]|uniref:15216_t:CDS:1 n=1 Tax=Funneliformis caledonium TaxID=1117310 RepID=A0A9N8YSH2_9GLOM|nr:15216_t:CDS:2 [Funneliformis caledonium]
MSDKNLLGTHRIIRILDKFHKVTYMIDRLLITSKDGVSNTARLSTALRYKDEGYPTGLGLREHPLMKQFLIHIRKDGIAIPSTENRRPLSSKPHSRAVVPALFNFR